MRIDEIRYQNEKYYYKKYEGFQENTYKWFTIFFIFCSSLVPFLANMLLSYQNLMAKASVTELGNIDVRQWVEDNLVWLNPGSITSFINFVLVLGMFLWVNKYGKSYELYKSRWLRCFPVGCHAVNGVVITISNVIDSMKLTGSLLIWCSVILIVLLMFFYSGLICLRINRPEYVKFLWRIMDCFVKKIIDKL